MNGSLRSSASIYLYENYSGRVCIIVSCFASFRGASQASRRFEVEELGDEPETEAHAYRYITVHGCVGCFVRAKCEMKLVVVFDRATRTVNGA